MKCIIAVCLLGFHYSASSSCHVHGFGRTEPAYERVLSAMEGNNHITRLTMDDLDNSASDNYFHGRWNFAHSSLQLMERQLTSMIGCTERATHDEVITQKVQTLPVNHNTLSSSSCTSENNLLVCVRFYTIVTADINPTRTNIHTTALREQNEWI